MFLDILSRMNCSIWSDAPLNVEFEVVHGCGGTSSNLQISTTAINSRISSSIFFQIGLLPLER